MHYTHTATRPNWFHNDVFVTDYFKDNNCSKAQMVAPWWWLLNRNV